MRAKKYSVYNAKTDQPVAIYQGSKDCAKAMGITLNSFYGYIARERSGKVKHDKWIIYDDGEATENEYVD